MLTVIVLTNEEKFLKFLDSELCNINETIEKDGLRTLDFEYTFQDYAEEKQLFRIGNKILILDNEEGLKDCLYVINTPLVEDVYKENCFKMQIEEVLVELNYAPLFSSTQLTAANGFTLQTTNGEKTVKVDWNALNFWFGQYFNIGVIQDCLGTYADRIIVTGTVTLMTLLRSIEEQTGNIFVTRYELDILTNKIHRYLDFLNPINVSKNWVLNIEYDFIEERTGCGIFSDDDIPISDTYDDVYSEDDIVIFPDYAPARNIDPSDVEFRITNKEGKVLNQDGRIYNEGEEETPLSWSSDDVGFDAETQHVVISLTKTKNNVGLCINEKSFVIMDSLIGDTVSTGFVSVESEPVNKSNSVIPDDSFFEIFSVSSGKAIFRTQINSEIGHVHEEVLSLGRNLGNVEFETDEEDTFSAISPILNLSDSNEDLTLANLNTIISRYMNLEITRGEIIPMIIQKVNVIGSSLPNAISNLGTLNTSSNYFTRPLHPNDQTGSYEFLRATAYWRAPFSKAAGELHVTTDAVLPTQYQEIQGRPDSNDERAILARPKMGTVETSSEDKYAIYNAVALKLKDKMYPDFNIAVDVVNLKDNQFNQYDLHDKVYIKLPESQELITARVVKTSKSAHEPSKNTIELSNYSWNSTIKNVQNETFIDATNVSFKYPNSQKLTARLVNIDYDENDDDSIHYPANQMMTFIVYSLDDTGTRSQQKTYTKLTDANGYASINMKYDPGNYEIEIGFGGDEEYLDSSITIEVNVSGTKTVTNTTTSTANASASTSNSKVTKKTTSSTTQTKRYYSKYGVSPDGRYIMGIGRPSASGELNKYGYKFYKTIFYRKCPMCGSTELYWSIFWAGNEKGNWGKFPATGRQESGSAEGQIFCKKCDADFSIFGKNHNSNHKGLTVYKIPVKSSKADAYSLKKGKMYYDTITKKVATKNNTSTKNRTHTASNIPSAIVKQALSIVGDSEGLAAAKKIAEWCGRKKNLKYESYANFKHSPSTTKRRKKANCCDSTWYMLTLMDAAGCTEKLKLEYVHVTASDRGHVFARITTRSSGAKRYVDPCCKIDNGRNPWGDYIRGYGSPPGNTSVYPTKPF